MSDKYSDIINLEHPDPKNHPRMSIDKRAGIFAPFAALTGYEDDVKETGRETESEIEINEDVKERLDQKLGFIIQNIYNQPKVLITFFLKDNKKSGGKYITKEVNIKSIDIINNQLITTRKEIINIEDIINIEGDMFNESYQ